MAEKMEEGVQGPVPVLDEAEQTPPVAAEEEEKKPGGEEPPTEEEGDKEEKTKLVVDVLPKEEKKKKPKQPKNASHPPYFQMIKDALLALNEKSGSSPYAIAKFMEEKHKAVLPSNFRRTLALQLKNSAAKGKLVKIRASYKLSESGKKVKKSPPKAAADKKSSATTTKPKKPRTKKTRSVNKPETGKKTPAALKPKKSAPAKVKQPRSIRSSAAKRVKKANAASASA